MAAARAPESSSQLSQEKSTEISSIRKESLEAAMMQLENSTGDDTNKKNSQDSAAVVKALENSPAFSPANFVNQEARQAALTYVTKELDQERLKAEKREEKIKLHSKNFFLKMKGQVNKLAQTAESCEKELKLCKVPLTQPQAQLLAHAMPRQLTITMACA